MFGRKALPPRPWLGWLVSEGEDTLVVTGLLPGCPAQRDGVRAGDVIEEVAGQRVNGLANLFRRIWSLGDAGVSVSLIVLRDGDLAPDRR